MVFVRFGVRMALNNNETDNLHDEDGYANEMT